jgi:hypothetical protein
VRGLIDGAELDDILFTIVRQMAPVLGMVDLQGRVEVLTVRTAIESLLQ